MFELALRIDGPAHRHGGHLRVERAVGGDAEGPDKFAGVLADGECAFVRREGDAVGVGEIGGGDALGLRGGVEERDLLLLGLGKKDVAAAGDNEVVGLHVFEEDFDGAGRGVDGEETFFCTEAAVEFAIGAEL